MIDHARALALIGPFEGRVEHMYLDSVGKVTVGIGNMLPTPQTAIALDWRWRDGGPEPGDVEIADEWTRIHGAVPGLLAQKYKPLTRLVLFDSAIDQLFGKRVDEFETSLQHLFPPFTSWPEPAQLATLDMVFNVGVGNLMRHFPHLCASLLEQDWRAAALHSHRAESHDARNEAVRGLFEEAAGVGAVPAREIT